MSVTFSAYANGQFLAPENFVQEYEIDPMYGKLPTNQNPWELNLANGNYCRVMEILGLDSAGEDGYCGQWEGNRLMEVKEQIDFVLDSLAAIPQLDGGTETIVHSSPMTATMIECGLREGYFIDRLSTLREIVNAAIKANGLVVWA